MLLAETTGTDTVYYLHGLDLIAQSNGVSAEYFTYDGLGSVRQVVDGMGDVVLAQGYDPYGNPYARAGEGVTSWGFAGEQTDANGLVFLRARYYQPRVGRFLTKDAWHGNLTRLLTLNRWGYVEDNPINLVDPSGYITEVEEEVADGILEDLNSRYQVLILKDYGWGPDNSQGYGICQNKWHKGAWKDIDELRWVQEAIFKTADKMGGHEKFQAAMNGNVTIMRRGIPAYEFSIYDIRVGPIRAFAPPFGVILGDINLPDYAFSNKSYAIYGVVHELGHVWDRRTSLELSRGLMVHMETLVCEGMGGCWFNIWAGRELPPGRIDEFKNYAATSPMEDWAESFASTVFPDYYNRAEHRMIRPLREQYVLDQIAKLP